MSHLWNKNLTNVDSEYFCFPKINLCLFKQLIFLLDNLLYKAIQLCYREEIFNEENKQTNKKNWHFLILIMFQSLIS